MLLVKGALVVGAGVKGDGADEGDEVGGHVGRGEEEGGVLGPFVPGVMVNLEGREGEVVDGAGIKECEGEGFEVESSTWN